MKIKGKVKEESRQRRRKVEDNQIRRVSVWVDCWIEGQPWTLPIEKGVGGSSEAYQSGSLLGNLSSLQFCVYVYVCVWNDL